MTEFKEIIINDNKTGYFINENGELKNKKGQFLEGSISVNGYKNYSLRINGQLKSFRAHRLVAEYFLPNPNNYDIVNHKDNNKLNNNVNNLEWCSQSYNVQYGYDNNTTNTKGYFKREKYKEDLPNEKWNPVFEGIYLISNMGRVRNNETNFILTGKKGSGYIRYELRVDGKRKTFLGHRLVYYAFNPDFDIYDTSIIINHINGDKMDNSLINLESLTQSENMLHSYYKTKTNSRIKPVYQLNEQHQIINTYSSCAEAARATNNSPTLIRGACIRKGKSKGYYWLYIDDYEKDAQRL